MSVKLQLLLDNPGDVRSGYLNIDPLAPPNDPLGRIQCNVAGLDPVVDDAEASEILALDILDYFPAQSADAVLTHWLSKLARGGTLTLSVIDIREVARAVIANKLSDEDANELIHGRQTADWDYRKSCYHLGRLVEVLSNLGYRILSKRIENFRAIISVQRT